MKLIINGLCGFLTQVSLNYAFLALPMAIVMIILGTLPFVLSLLSLMLLGERMDLYTVCTMIVCFGAIVLLAFANSDSDDMPLYLESHDRSG